MRVRLTLEDMLFLASDNKGTTDPLEFARIAQDEKRVLELVSDEEKFNAITGLNFEKKLSPQLYILAVVNRIFDQSRIGAPELTLYVSWALSNFCYNPGVPKIQGINFINSAYLRDLIQLTENARRELGDNAFFVYQFAGEATLLMVGIFPRHISYHHRFGHVVESGEGYEKWGPYFFYKSANLRPRRHHAVEMLSSKDRFKAVTGALNKVSEKYFGFETQFGKMMRQMSRTAIDREPTKIWHNEEVQQGIPDYRTLNVTYPDAKNMKIE